MLADPRDDLSTRLATLGLHPEPGRPATFTAPGRGVRVRDGVAEVLVFGEHWVDAASVCAAIDGTVPTGQSEPISAALGAARLPAYRPPGRDLHHRCRVDVDWWDAEYGGPDTLEVEVTYNYFDEDLFMATWDSITADRDARWAPPLPPADAARLAHALWLAAGGELAPEPPRFGPVTLLPMLGDRCEVRVLESADHPKLVGRRLLLDLDILRALHTTLRYFPRLCG